LSKKNAEQAILELDEPIFGKVNMSLEQQLKERLQSLNPTYLEIVNESAGHGGYYPGKESHFKVVIVSEIFAGLRLVQRHQKVYAAVGELLGAGIIHALAIHAFIADEWQGQDTSSPECAHAPKTS
jgi:BolA family transcriptional regulator, general stress-responsive regulator